MRAMKPFFPLLITANCVLAFTIAAPAADEFGEIAKRFFSNVYGGNPAVVDELAADDIVSTYPVFSKLYGIPAIRGREAYKKFAENFASSWKDGQTTYHDIITEGNRVVLLWSFKAVWIGQEGEMGMTANEEHSWGGITIIKFNGAGKVVLEVGEESEPGPFYRLSATTLNE